MPRLLCPSWRWITTRGTPSWAISTAWACRSWCGAKRPRTSALAAVRRRSDRAAALGPAPAARGSGDDAEERPDGQLEACVEPWLELLPAPCVHADFAASSAFALPH